MIYFIGCREQETQATQLVRGELQNSSLLCWSQRILLDNASPCALQENSTVVLLPWLCLVTKERMCGLIIFFKVKYIRIFV